ncbi:DUF3035 domain-containing protein [Pseudemcibacter aquimaris]|uniref:DUF3035 domain-containing protein n=1 Tax=Pseudemcibacter aquimaris TaxID=2857064 RepID=UPI00201376CB|nr:DUF3035 domain-containing protein [Pseudemcibacter aquimaris]MCC3862293.1 DUF3035 domain-containing protein [Pseudemcibacter aquimaris]WDU59041.1 DUF3035 domain-containing protein [Pseudemcibacter aquimaris]
MKNKLVLVTFMTALVAMISGCSGKQAPDEFLVLKNAPLTLPPEYHLSPGDANEDLIDVNDPQAIAKRALFGEGQ